MPDSDQNVSERPISPFKPIPEHLYDALVATIRATLGNDWGVAKRPQNVHVRQIRERLKTLTGAYMAGNPELDQHGLHIEVWVDFSELDPSRADTVAVEVLDGLGAQEVLLLCRSYEEEGIRYRFASGTMDAGVIGSMRLIGPNARDIARLGQIGSGQSTEFSA
ncbi:hypothetical protein BH24CHL2_BH24CHL2_4080 [soil metagenome]